MKLNLLFIVMELLIVLAYPIVFVHGKLRKLFRPGEGIPPVNFFGHVPAKAGR